MVAKIDKMIPKETKKNRISMPIGMKNLTRQLKQEIYKDLQIIKIYLETC